MLKAMGVISLVVLTGAASTADAITCKRDIKPVHHRFLLNKEAAKPTIYLIENISHQEVTLDKQHKGGTASAGWASLLKPSHWSAIYVTEKHFPLICSVPNCDHVLHVCIADVEKTNLESGSYWLVEDKGKADFNEELERRLKK